MSLDELRAALLMQNELVAAKKTEREYEDDDEYDFPRRLR